MVAADPVATPAPAGIEHPTGQDDVVLRIESSGGLRPVDYAFTEQPSLLLTGDGRLLVPPTAGTPARIVAMDVATLDEEQVQQLLDLAEDAGLLATPPDYTDTTGPQVADAQTTTVTVSAGGATWTHEAYALGFGEQGGARAELSDFVDAAAALVADLEVESFEPAEVALLVQPTDLEQEVAEWPLDGVVLADAASCLVVPAEGVVEVLLDAGPVTSFRQGGALYSVSGAEVLPGASPCGG